MESYRTTIGTDGGPRVGCPHRGHALLSHSVYNKGTAFTVDERRALGLKGVLPPEVNTIEQQGQRAYQNLIRKPDPLERYVGLAALHDRNETLFFRVLADHMDELLPIVYTPTVGLACQRYSHIFRRARGLWITPDDAGKVEQVLQNAPFDDVRLIVVTDNERILGLGDLGAGGMGIPVGKLAIYTVAAGIHPTQTLPVSLDVGTDNVNLLADPLYLGHRGKRLRGPKYDALVDEFVHAVKKVFPKALLQWEDFKKANAFRLLDRYRQVLPSFNDDIQGTAAVTLAAFYAAGRATGTKPRDQRVVIVGAGAAGIGIAQQLRDAFARDGLAGEALGRAIVLLDSKGILQEGSIDEEHKRPFAWSAARIAAFGLAKDQLGSLVDVVRAVKPTVLVGTSGQPGVFDEAVCRAMAAACPRPAIFPLSNPTDLAEGKPAELQAWCDGRAVIATGSPFPPVTVHGKTTTVSQANNAYIFPGLGLGAIVAGAHRVTDTMFYAAARTLAGLVDAASLEQGRLFPPLPTIRSVSAHIAVAVANVAYEEGLATVARPDDLDATVRAAMYDATYPQHA